MTENEFKAWFEGFSEGIDGSPTEKQWERIKKQVKSITGTPVTERVFVDRYWRDSRPWWEVSPVRPFYGVQLCANSAAGAGDKGMNATYEAPAEFNSVNAMYTAGKYDATHLES